MPIANKQIVKKNSVTTHYNFYYILMNATHFHYHIHCMHKLFYST